MYIYTYVTYICQPVFCKLVCLYIEEFRNRHVGKMEL